MHACLPVWCIRMCAFGSTHPRSIQRPERSSVPLHYTRPYSLQSGSLTEPSSQLTPEIPLLLHSLQHWGYKSCLALLEIQTQVPEQVILSTEPFLSTALEECVANYQVQIGVPSRRNTMYESTQQQNGNYQSPLCPSGGTPHPGDQQTV